MNVYASYPPTYRSQEVQAVWNATQAGECVSIVGLSGSGKSNLMGFMEYHFGLAAEGGQARYYLVDCNRLARPAAAAFFALLGQALAERQAGDLAEPADDWSALDRAIESSLQTTAGVCLLLDRFDALSGPGCPPAEQEAICSGLRALRDAHKYVLTYVTATRRPTDPHSELAELFFAHTLWLGPLSPADAHWTAGRFAGRRGLTWGTATLESIRELAGGYPSFVRAICEAHASGAALELPALRAHPIVQRRVQEFLEDQPTPDMLRWSGLAGHPLLPEQPAGTSFDAGQLTAKENLLWVYFHQHPDQVCEKDELVQAVWPEDRIFERGVRDDSLAQLVRRLREKIEPDPSNPRHILTVAGRGYRYCP